MIRWVTLIYVVQHGQKERLAGDPGLTALGKIQAAVTAQWLQTRGLKALYSSPLRRAQETGAPIAAATGLPVQLDDRLRERWNWDGRQTLDVFLADWNRSSRDRDFVLPNGESSWSAGKRMREFLASLAREPGPFGAVSHGGVIVDLLRTLLGDDVLSPRLLQEGVPDCAITMIDDLHVVAVATTGHLHDAVAQRPGAVHEVFPDHAP